MTIRAQNLLFLVPIFLIAGLLIGGLKWAADTQTLESGGREQIRTFAIALREFLQEREKHSPKKGLESINNAELKRDLDRVQQLFDLRTPEVTTGAFAQFFDDNLGDSGKGRGGAPGVVILDPDSREVVFSSAPESFKGDLGATVQEMIRKRGGVPEDEKNTVWIPDISASFNSPDNLWAFARLKDASGNTYGYLGVQYDGSWIQIELLSSIVEIGIGIFVVFVAGVIIALFISFVLTRTLRNLTEAASRAADGDYNVSIRTGLIEEFNDLGNTFRTMTSLLFDTLDRIRKTLIEQEQFRNTDDLMSTFRSEVYGAVDVDLDWIKARMAPLRGHPRGYFYKQIEYKNGLLFFMGWVHESSEPDDLVGSAVARYLTNRLFIEENLENALDDTFNVFGVRKLLAVQILPNPAHAVQYLLDSEHRGAEISKEEFGSIPGRGLIFHTLSETFGQRIETALRHMEQGSVTSVHEEIRSIALPGEDGVVLFVRG